MAKKSTCKYCNHEASSHIKEAGFYDVKARLGKCDVVGCSCEKFRA